MSMVTWLLTSYAATVTVAAAYSKSMGMPLETLSFFQALLHSLAAISIPIFGGVTLIGIVYSLALTAGSTGWDTHLEKMLSNWLTFEWGKHVAISTVTYLGHIAMVIIGFIGVTAVTWRMQTTLTGWVFTISLGMLTAGIFWLGCQIGVALSEGNA